MATASVLLLCLLAVVWHVGCDGVVGSNRREDTCGVCGGDNSTCRIVSGLFTQPRLPVGYNLIAQIPRTACNLTISELKHSRNYLALRRRDGSFVINGNWAINWSGEYEAAGTKFSYRRDEETEDTLETISAPGPLQEPLDLMVIFQQPNPGIKYEYQLPMLRPQPAAFPPNDGVIAPPLIRHNPGSMDVTSSDVSGLKENGQTSVARHIKPQSSYGNGADSLGLAGDEAAKPRNKSKKRKFAWRVSGFTECSKSCGGGYQTSKVACVREHNQIAVPERRCANFEKPPLQTMRCNTKPCVAEWVGGEWSDCSVSCGEGVETREILCRQEISPTLTMTVSEGACLTPPSPLLHRTRLCQRPPCSASQLGDSSQWKVGSWTQCSSHCGLGVRTRSVECLGNDCLQSDRPIHQSVCDMGPCGSFGPHTWFTTDWSQQCSEGCGTGVQTRKVHCSGKESHCDPNTKPEHTRACSSDKECGGRWFAGNWGQCSSVCGWGQQSRSVLCIGRMRGENVITEEANCNQRDRPQMEQRCQELACGSQWYTADWSPCSRSCDIGVERREVRCLDENGTVMQDCEESTKPASRRSCNTQACTNTDERVSRGHDRKEGDNQPGDQALVEQTLSSAGECIDQFRNCHLVVQARLCKYKYYRTSCCHACHNKTQDNL